MKRIEAVREVVSGRRRFSSLAFVVAVLAAVLSSWALIAPERILNKPADLTIVHLTDLHLSTKAGGNRALMSSRQHGGEEPRWDSKHRRGRAS